MILTKAAIEEGIANGSIHIDPFNTSQLNPNSYNLQLASTLGTYLTVPLDARANNAVVIHEIPDEGWLLKPGILYLGRTVERTSTRNYIPVIDGRSSFARLGVSIHSTGGLGGIGFNGTWTLEISVVMPVRIYRGMQIAQIRFHTPKGEVTTYYDGKYQGQVEPTPCKLYTENE